MANETQLAALMIRSTTPALAGFVAAELAGEPEQPSPDGASFDAWKGHAERRLLELHAALTLEEPALLAEEVRWSRHAFDTRNLPTSELERCLRVLSGVLGEQLPAPAAATARAYLDSAIPVLAEPVAGNVDDGLDARAPRGEAALRYLEAVLEGDRRRATGIVLAAHDGGMPLLEIVEDILLAAQREVGRLWHLGELGVAEEHFCTSTTQRTLTTLCHHVRAAAGDEIPAVRGTVVAASTEGDAHDMVLRVLADLFEMNGWRSILLGPSLPPRELLVGLRDFEADVLVLSATLITHLPALAATIAQLRDELPDQEVKVVVGGRALRSVEGIWRKLGADAYAPTIADALRLAEDLAGNRTS